MFAKHIADRALNMMTAFLLLLCGWLIIEYKIPEAFKGVEGFGWMLAWNYAYGHFLVWLCACCLILALHRLLSKEA